MKTLIAPRSRMKTLTILAFTLIATGAQAAEVKVVKSGKNMSKDYPGMQAVTLYMTSEVRQEGPAAIFTPPAGKDFLITQVCTNSSGGVKIANQYLDLDLTPRYDDPNFVLRCQTFTPGIVAPLNEPIGCHGDECIVTGWMKP